MIVLFSLHFSTKEEYLRIFDVNVFGVSDVTQTFVPLLRKRGQDKIKKILNISSGLGSITLARELKLPMQKSVLPIVHQRLS